MSVNTVHAENLSTFSPGSQGSRPSSFHNMGGENVQGDDMSIPSDDELLFGFQHARKIHEEMLEYQNTGRGQALAEAQQTLQDVHNIECAIELTPPDARGTFIRLRDEKVNVAQHLSSEVERLDQAVPQARLFLMEQLEWLYSYAREQLATFVMDMSWLTFSICQELNLSSRVVNLVLNPKGVVGSEVENEEIKNLRRLVQSLQEEKKKWETKEIDSAKDKRPSHVFDRNTNEIKERRRRIQLPVFGGNQGTHEAKDWLAEYKSIANHLKFSEKERLEDLEVRFKGMALSWFNYLAPETKESWVILEKAFLEYFAGGENTLETALNELTSLRQGNTPMSLFGQKLRDIARRAGIHNDKILIGYLKKAVNPKMTRAIIYRGPKTYDDAMNICIEVETDLSQLAKAKTDYTPAFLKSTTGHTGRDEMVQEQNYQRKFSQKGSAVHTENKQMRCFRCKKLGHMKKNCRVNIAKQNQQMTVEEQNSDTNISSQFLQNSQKMTKNELLPRRFYLDVISENGCRVKALIDTGSTMSSITNDMASEMELDQVQKDPEVMHYGNNSTQISSGRALMKFTFNNNETSKVSAFVVNKQNEQLILGMDWIVNEDIILYPRKSKVTTGSFIQNSAMEIEEMIKTKYPKLVEESEDSNALTNAPYEHRIDTGDAIPYVGRDYRRSEPENQASADEVQKMLKKGVVIPSSSNWCSPVVLVKKPDGSYRFCVDYRGLNRITIKDKYPIPRIAELVDRLTGSKWFTTIDLKSGYWQLPLAKEDRKKTAFIANGSLYEFTCLPFGVANGPSSFMRFMHMILRGLPRTMVYLDDIISFGRTEEEHLQDVVQVLDRLSQYNLRIFEKKCQFFKKEVQFLGFLVGENGIRSNPEGTKVIQDWPAPTGVKPLMRFLGFCVFYHKFIKDLSITAKPLYKLTRKDVEFCWDKTAQEVFQKLKQQVMTLPTLALPDPAIPYDLHCDASNVGLGAALVQNGRPVAFASRTLSSAEENYNTTEKECLAVRWALEHFHPLVHGANLTVYTDHAALKSILATRMPRGRIARWILDLQSYQFEIVHKKGVLNQDADALSRVSQQNYQNPTDMNADTFKKLQLADPEIKILLQEGVKKPFIWKNETVGRMINDKVCMPLVPRVLVPWILKKCHDDSIGGHFGKEKTLDKARQIGWWFQMTEDVEVWVKHCEGCQRRKIRTENASAPMKPITATYLGEIWASDVATLTTSKKGNRYLLVFMEYLSKWVVTAALSSFDTDHVVQVLLFEIVLKLGVPARLITDNGSNYISEAMVQVCKRLGIKKSLTSVEHPQSDGLVERLNRTIKTSLAICSDHDPFNWDDQLPFVTFAYNTAIQASTRFSLFEVLFGRKASIPLLPELGLQDTTAYETEPWVAYLKNHIPLIHGTAMENIKKAQLKQKRTYNKGNRVKYDNKKGDLIASKNLEKSGFPKERWTGPWVVLKINNAEGTSFKIIKQDDRTQHITTANAKHMRPWFAQDVRQEVVMGSSI